MSKKPVKIGTVISSLRIGGAENLVLTECKRFDRSKYNINVYYLYNSNYLMDSFVREGIPVKCLNMRGDTDIRGIFKLAQVLRKDKIDMVHAHTSDAIIYGSISAKLAKVKFLISTQHSTMKWKIRKNFRSRFRLLMERIAARCCNQIICVSKDVRDYHAKIMGTARDKMIILYSGIENELFQMKCKKKNIKGIKLPSDIFLIGTVGRLIPEKGHTILLDAIQTIIKKYSRVLWLFIGDGPERGAIEEKIKRLSLSNFVKLLGVRSDVNIILPVLDLFVLPSIREGLPLSILEAMACDVPVLATKVGGIPELIDDGITGFLVPPGSSSVLADKILKILRNRQDLKQLSRNAFKLVEKDFCIEKHIKNLESIYDKLLDEKILI